VQLVCLSGLGDATGSNAAGAHAHALSGLPDDDVDMLQIRFPASLRQIVGVTYPMTINRALITNLTTSHEGNLPREMNAEYNVKHVLQSTPLLSYKEFLCEICDSSSAIGCLLSTTQQL
jgi:hypothetical protein